MVRRIMFATVILVSGCGGNQATLVQPTQTTTIPVTPVVPASPPGTLSIEPGEYDLTFAAAAACDPLDVPVLQHHYPGPWLDDAIPEELRTREYTANVAKISGTQYRVTPRSTATFSALGVMLDVAGHDVSFMDDMGFWERLPSFTYLEFDGSATATIDAPSTSSFEMSYWGSLTYCRLKSELGYFKNCWNSPSEQIIERSNCGSRNHRIVFHHR